MERFVGKTAIITGGSKGLGRAFAERLGSEGAKVMITARTQTDLDKAVAELEDLRIDAFSVTADMADAEGVRSVAEAAMTLWGRIDVLVNNAGLFDDAEFLDIELENWNYVLSAMLTGPFLLAQLCAREMVKTGGGSIVNITSIDGHVADGPYASYGAAKAGLQTLTKYIAVSLARRGVRCNSISPGWVDTPMTQTATPELLHHMRTDFTRVPLGRLLTVQELAAACAFLASDEASGITGIDLVVDGGTLADGHIIPAADAAVELTTIKATGSSTA